MVAKNKSPLGVIFLLVGWGLVLGAPHSVLAANVLISPALQQIDLGASDKGKGYILVLQNNTNQPVNLHLQPVDFGTLDEAGGVAFLGAKTGETHQYSLLSWLLLEKDDLTLQPGEEQEVKVAIENREDLSPGGHYAAVLAYVQSLNDNPGTGSSTKIAVKEALSSLIFLKKSGGEVYDLRLKDVTVLPSYSLNTGLRVEERFQNAGNVHAVPRGNLQLVDISGRVVGRGVINESSAIVLPQSFRRLTSQVNPDTNFLWPGWYRLHVYHYAEGTKASFSIIKTVIIGVQFLALAASLFLIFVITIIWLLRHKSIK